jgi:allophanate hydrolase
MISSGNVGRLEINKLRSAYRDGHLSPVDVVREAYERIGRSSAPNVWIHLADQEAVLGAARRLEGLNRLDLPLFGIPYAVKDNIDVAGMPTTAACPGFVYQAKQSASSVARLEAAGALCIGKTNLDQFATGISGVRSPYGACSAVDNPKYISGGSSSGSAVAVAAGVVSFALGTDTGGSGRIPAGFNNVVGVKPTRGLISTGGVVPNCRTLDCVSVFSLTTEDGHEVLRAARGGDDRDSFSRLDAAAADLSWPGRPPEFVFAVVRADQREFYGDAGAAALYEQAIQRFQHLGGKPIEIDFGPFLEAGSLMFSGPFVAERYAALRPFIEEKDGLAQMLPVLRTIIEGSMRWSGADAFDAIYRLAELRRQVAPILSKVKFLLVPTAPRPFTLAELSADPIGANNALGFYTYCVNLLDLAAISIPNGVHPDGVASGVTLVGPALADGVLASYAAPFHQLVGLPSGGREASRQ